MKLSFKTATGMALVAVALGLIYHGSSKDDAASGRGGSWWSRLAPNQETAGAVGSHSGPNHRRLGSEAGPTRSDDQPRSTRASRQRSSAAEDAAGRTKRPREHQASSPRVHHANGGVTPDEARRVFKQNFGFHAKDAPGHEGAVPANPSLRRPSLFGPGPEYGADGGDLSKSSPDIVVDDGKSATPRRDTADADRESLANDSTSENHLNARADSDTRNLVTPSILVQSSITKAAHDPDTNRVMTTFRIDETPDAEGRVSALIVSQRVPPGWQITQSNPPVSSFDERSRVAKWLLFAQPGYGESITYNSEAMTTNASVEDWDYAGSWYTYRDPDTTKTVSFQTIRP